jgi:hypothetical protein
MLDRKHRRVALTAFLLPAFVAVILILAWPVKRLIFDKPPQVSTFGVLEIDPLCEYMQKLQLYCVVASVTENVLGPGHFVAYASVAAMHRKVPFSNGDLLADVCAVPGTRPAKMRADLFAELKQQEHKNELPFDTIIYKLDRRFQVGTDLPIPKLANLRLKAGPNLNEVQDLSVNVPHG